MTGPDTGNPPGLTRLRRRVTDHDRAMRRMRAVLGARHDDHADDRALRAVSRHTTDDPAVALLDAWAVVCDTVAFYSERIAHEGLLRTAVRPGSVRELARTVGYQPDPGVAAEVDLAFTVDTGPLVPEVVTVPAGTPVQSVPAESTVDGPPGPAALPQIFETLAPVAARAAWNALAVHPEQPQVLPEDAGTIWLRGPVGVRPGDPILVIGTNPPATNSPATDPSATDPSVPTLCLVSLVEPDPGHPGWVRLTVTGDPPTLPTEVLVFAHRVRLFGWNAPDPNPMVVNPRAPEPAGITGKPPNASWTDFPVTAEPLDLEGEFPEIVKGSWVVVQQGDQTGESTQTNQAAYLVDSAVLSGKAAFMMSGRVTLVSTRTSRSSLRSGWDRRKAVVYCVPVRHDATLAPADSLAPGRLSVPAVTPPLETGRRVLLTWSEAGQPRAASATVESCAPQSGAPRSGARSVLTLHTDRTAAVPTGDLVVRGNVVRAGHGETVRQVLGSGDGATTFQTFRLRRTPLTFVATGGEGSRPELTVRVDDVEWLRVADLGDAGPTDRVYTLRLDEDGIPWVGFGDGVNGARLPTGTDNVVAIHRVGLGCAGAVAAGRLSQLPRRPLGIRDVTNPVAATGASDPEDMAQARANAPRRISTLDRAVSLADHERYAAGYPGIGAARADLVWDGRQRRIVVSVRSTDATDPDGPMLTRLHAALTAVRDPLLHLDVHAAEVLWFTATVQVRRDPRWPWPRVRDDVLAALHTAFGPWRVPFAAPVFTTALVSIVEKLPGVLSCRLPLIAAGGTESTSALTAEPARWVHDEVVQGQVGQGRVGQGGVAPAQVLALQPSGGVTVEEVE